MARHPIKYQHLRTSDRFASRALINGANALIADTAQETQADTGIQDPIEIVKLLFDGSDIIHEQPDALLEASNILAESGYYKLAAEAALEAMTLKPYGNYDEWYEHINRLLTKALEYIDAFDKSGNVIGSQLVEAARCARLLATSPIHKLILQEQDIPLVNKLARAVTAQRELVKIVVKTTDLARHDNDVRGFANETVQQASLLSKSIVEGGNIVVMAPTWADQTRNRTYTVGVSPSPNRDLLIYKRNTEFGNIQSKSTRPTDKSNIVDYAPSINVVYSNELLAKALKEHGIIPNRLYDFWQIATDVPKESVFALLDYFGPVLLDEATSAQPHQRRNFENRIKNTKS